MVGPNLPFGGLACELVLGPLPSPLLYKESLLWINRTGLESYWVVNLILSISQVWKIREQISQKFGR